MNKIVLFSPVGGTDPMSLSNCHDGSLLHICRAYQVDKVVMYMSKEICENHRKDNRYLYCLDKLGEFQERSMEYELIQKEDLEEVQDFNYFYREFSEIIKRLLSELDATDTLLLNISSGTPGMKSALLVLSTLGEFPCKYIQVSTPEKSMNEHIHKGYDVEILWELNEDNRKDFTNRCREVQCPALLKIKHEEVIKKHIEAYDYHAALQIAYSLPRADTERYLPLLRMANYRVLLDFKNVDQILGQQAGNYLPVRSGGGRKDFEYALTLNLKLKRGEYADFVRAITPLIVDLFELILKKQCGINVNDYCVKRKNGKNWSRQKLRETELDQILQEEYNFSFKYDTVKSDNLNAIVPSR